MRPVEGYEGLYSVTECGEVYSHYRDRMLKPYKKRDGYYVVSLVGRDKKVKYRRVHRLVAAAFCPKPEGCDIVNHKDMDIENNHADNLEWTTVSGNTKHAFDNSLAFRRNQALASAKGAAAMELEIAAYKNGRYIGRFVGKKKCADALGVSEKTVYNRINGRFSSRSGYDFKVVMPSADH